MKLFKLVSLGAVLATSLPTSAVVVVSNLSNLNESTWDLGPAGGAESVANAFTSGPGTDWTLNSVTMPLAENPLTQATPTLNVTVSLRSDNGGVPGTSLEDFIPMIPTLESNNVFTPQSPITLSPSTTYWLVATYADEEVVYWENTQDLSETSGSGWSIGDGAYALVGANWEELTLTGSTPTKFALDATAVPEPSALLLISMVGAPALFRRRRN